MVLGTRHARDADVRWADGEDPTREGVLDAGCIVSSIASDYYL